MGEKEEEGRDYVTILCSVFLVFVVAYIALVALFAVYRPAHEYLILNPIKLYDTYRGKASLYKIPYRDIYWNPARSEQTGVTAYKPEKAWDGLTLVTSVDEDGTKLIDMQGNVVHEWHLSYEKACPDSFRKGVPAPLYGWVRSYIRPNGDVFGLYDCYETTGLVKLDKDSHILWQYGDGAHHSVAEDEEGRIYTFLAVPRKEPSKLLPQIKPPFQQDFLLILGAGGQEIKRIDLHEAFAGSPAEHLLSQLMQDPTGGRLLAGDLLHPNTVAVIGKSAAGKYPMLVEGSLLLSFRNASLLAVLDPDTGKITWAAYGPWRGQHDPHIMPDGTIMLFDNEGWLGTGGASRVLRFDPQTLAILWQYTGDKDHEFYSNFNSAIDLLPNGNVLVTESSGGRLFEVTPEKEIVWEYRTPVRKEFDEEFYAPALFQASRHRREDLPFLAPGEKEQGNANE